eukprot:104139-Heterocapsa_arctica.AAC.1
MYCCIAASSVRPHRTVHVCSDLCARIRSAACASRQFAIRITSFAPVGDLHWDDITDGRMCI